MTKAPGSWRGLRRHSLEALLVTSAILVLTLWPLGQQAGFADDRLSARFGLADAVRNVMLFIPLGAVLARRGMGAAGILLRAALLSAAIELAQVEIPGRYGNLADVASNVAGALIGTGLVRTAAIWARPGPRGATRLATAWSAAVAAVLLATGVLLGPALPDAVYTAGWTTAPGALAPYSGQVVSVALGGEPLPEGRVEHSDRFRHGWLGGETLRVEVIAGDRTASLAPIFSLRDGANREVLLLGAERGDLVLRMRTRAQAASVDRPALRWPGVLDDVRPGTPITIGAKREGSGWCLSLGDRSACPLGFGVGSGWRLVWFPQRLPSAAGPWMNAAWLAALFLPLGFWLRMDWGSVLAASIATGALLAAPRTGLLPPQTAEILACAWGAALGAVLRWALEASTRAPGR